MTATMKNKKRPIVWGTDFSIQAMEAGKVAAAAAPGIRRNAKWRAVFKQSAAEKFVVANAPDGDASSYIDPFSARRGPHALLEAVPMAGYGVGASKGWIYLRKEYPGAEASLERAMTEAHEARLLGERVLSTDFQFDIELCIGQGSYVCGEETALLNSIEGRRPEGAGTTPIPHGAWPVRP